MCTKRKWLKLMHKFFFFYSLRLRNSKVKSKLEFQIILDKTQEKSEKPVKLKCKQLKLKLAISRFCVALARVLLNHQLTTEKFSCSLRLKRAHNHFSTESNDLCRKLQAKDWESLNKKKWTIWTFFASFYFYLFFFYVVNIFCLNVH